MAVKEMLKGQILLDLEVFSSDDILRLVKIFRSYAEVVSVSARCQLVFDDEDDESEDE